MIHVFFVPGMFGSTIEYVLRNFTIELESVAGQIQHDGSMHSFAKQNHILNSKNIFDITNQQINTPIYPFSNLSLQGILKIYPVSNFDDRYILIYADSIEAAELNILFQYYKISIGLKQGFDIFCSEHKNMSETVKRWNANYNNYKDMQPWEFREWFSLFYLIWIQEWQESVNQVPDNWLKISSTNILTDTTNTFRQILNYCNLTETPGIEEFVGKWQTAQQYIFDEYKLLAKIVHCTIHCKPLSWKPLNIISEGIIQQNLRSKGFELRCDGLNTFPTNSIDLYNLLDNSLKLHHTQGQI